MKLYYIYHSGFAIESDEVIIIIDYFYDSDSDKIHSGIVHNQLLKSDKKIYVLSTHAHPDHFNPHILTWKDQVKNIKYIFSKDILDFRLCKKEEAEFLDKGDLYQDDMLSIEAFGSTDQGVSFLIHFNNKLIFHAGDLNNWHWKADSTEEESAEAERFYLEELTDIYRKYKAIDLVMFPVDQRMRTDYFLGAQQFIEKIHTNYFAPMHFDEDYQGATAFKVIASNNNTQFLEITERGQSFDLNL